MQKLYTVESSQSQNCLHFDELQRVININSRKFLMQQNNDWTIIGVFETVEEADKFFEIANKELINRRINNEL